jgi:ribosomal protein S18 acetylase RimI-like enzyme
MRDQDMEPVVTLHQQAFDDNFMTTFGKSFLRAFYRELIAHRDGYGCVAVAGDEVIGFCVGGTGAIQGLARGTLLRSPLAFALPALANVVRAPARGVRLAKLAFGYLGPGAGRDGASGEAHLLQIAIAERWRGSGAAELLVRRFVDEMERRGAANVLLGVEPDNARAIAFYRKMGFREVRKGIFERRLPLEIGAAR